ncbi:Polysaccharide deacetylase [Reichenbachiella faecimaris]|uniref:Polysaccharide deacetylase n=1 Tax=Reichenbachiella faecimaris TaxID=692418 RepID=A0A1W2GEA5_REIFA|nr:polysaccharide deacetylase family protein [Reichenbachiella faecimaris]SMD34586.1 Polysaccharide deacetylase [Reichenbachiella faecimaris]
MHFSLSLFTSFLLITFNLKSQPKQVCLSVDDLTVVNYGINDTTFTYGITRSLIHTFKKYQIPAIGYVNERKVYTKDTLDMTKVKHLELWAGNGYDLGNHTYAHLSYHNTPFDEYTAGILRGEQVTRPLLKKYGKKLKYFRHPYLQVGLTQSAYDSLNQFLADHNYIVAPITIDNSDWRFAKAYSDAYKKGDVVLMEKIGEAYVEYMEQVLVYYENQSIKLFGRVIAQTLLTHASYLNAQYLDEVMQKYVAHGYQFVSQEEALKETAYQTEVTYFDNWGISWIHRWALSQGKPKEFFKDEPTVPEFIQ